MGHAPMSVIDGSCGLHTGLRAFWKNTPSCRAALTGKAHSGVDAPPARSIDLPRTVGVHPRSPWGAASHGGYGCLLQLGRLRVHRLLLGSQCNVPGGTPQAPNCSCGLITCEGHYDTLSNYSRRASGLIFLPQDFRRALDLRVLVLRLRKPATQLERHSSLRLD